MSKWELRSPDSFPPDYGRAVYACLTGSPTAIIHTGYSVAEAEYHADMFRCWRWCIRHYPLHSLHQIENQFNIRLRRIQRHDLYEIHVSVVPKVSVDPLLAALEIESPEDFAEIG